MPSVDFLMDCPPLPRVVWKLDVNRFLEIRENSLSLLSNMPCYGM